MRRRLVGQRYQVEQLIATGTWSEVFLGYDLTLMRPVAVKLLYAGPPATWDLRGAFSATGFNLSDIAHPHVVGVLDVGEDAPRPYQVLEYLPGDTLTTLIDQEGPFHVDDVAILVSHVAAGLDHLHRHAISHGLLAPHHVIVDSAGLARIAGIPPRLPPDQRYLLAADEVGSAYQPDPQDNWPPAQADVSALAAIAYEMLTGQRPSRRPNAPNALSSVPGPSDIAPSVPRQASAVVMASLADPGHPLNRSAMTFSQALTNWRFYGDSTPGQRPSAPTPPETGRRSPVSDTYPQATEPRVQKPQEPFTMPTGPAITHMLPSQQQRGSRVRALTVLIIVAVIIALGLVIFGLEDAPTGTSSLQVEESLAPPPTISAIPA